MYLCRETGYKMQSPVAFMLIFSQYSGFNPDPVRTSAGLQLAERVQTHDPFWYFIYLFVLLCLYAWIGLYYGNVMIQTFQASTNFQLSSKMFRNNSLLQNQLDGILYLFYFVSTSFLLYYLELKLDLFPYGLQGGSLLLFNLGLLAGIFILRAMFHNIAGFLFDKVRIIREYLYNMFIFNKLMGLVILPMMFLLVYTRGILQDIIFWSGIFVLAVILALRIVRGLVFSYKKGVLIFYMFLYLCALEIAPLVLLYRWLEGIL